MTHFIPQMEPWFDENEQKAINDYMKEGGWIPYDIAIEKLTDRWYKTVRRVDIKVTEFHHTLIEIFTTEA